MKKKTLAVLLLTGICCSLYAQHDTKTKKSEKTVMVGGAAMYPSRNIVENAVHSADHTTLVAAVKSAGLVETLQGAGPFTVFAPTNAAFDKLPPGTVADLVKPENRNALTRLLTYHVVAGRFDGDSLKQLSKKGTAELTTVQGEKIWIMRKDGAWWIRDEKGGMARITIADVYQQNGIIHVIDGVLMPKG